MSKIYFISDLHFSDKRMLKRYPASRPFENVEEMNEFLLDFWNSKIRPEDTVYNLGDLWRGKDKSELEEILKKLNGKHHLILGNNDDFLESSNEFDKYLIGKDYYLCLNDLLKTRRIILLHYPIYEWRGKIAGNIHLHGHIHDLIPPISGRIQNVAYDLNHNFIELDEIISKFEIFDEKIN